LHIQGNQASFNNIVLAPDSGRVAIGVASPTHRLHVCVTPGISIGIGGAVNVPGSVSINAINDTNTANIPLEIRAEYTSISAGILIQPAWSTAPNDTLIGNNRAVIWFDEASSRLAFRCRNSAGVLKTGYVNVS
jgi:hypothetical protein